MRKKTLRRKHRRDDLMEQVIQLARLPHENRTLVYLSKRQLESLVVYLTHIDMKLRETSDSLDVLIRQSEEFSRNHGQYEMGSSKP